MAERKFPTEYRSRRRRNEDDFDIEITDEDVRAYDRLDWSRDKAPEDIQITELGALPAPAEKEAPAKTAAPARPAKRRRILPVILVLVLLAAAAGFAAHRILLLRACLPAKQEYASYTTADILLPDDTAEDGKIPDLSIDWDALEKTNDHLAGVLYFPALDLAVPYTAGEDTAEALSTTFGGSDCPVGQITCSPDTDASFSGMNAVLLGSRAPDGSLFGGFSNLIAHPEKLQKDPYVYVYTKSWRRCYQVYSGFTAMNTDPVLRPASTESKYRYCITLAMSRNRVDGLPSISDYTAESEPLLTLSAGSSQSRTYGKILCAILTKEESTGTTS
ncbi:MAG: hypothetical protein LKH04_05560 [Lachnospiraceae bacterium]|jgi:hypothetical protein|nr:hypothetical protein [Lachnospiraceae bacterium]MCI1397633.1 hypothetical protein [Lachnospiraceae bacterium]MCI1423756.1 hypothetical protein [Lachnospiraceae bacterium]MCI1452540.1 hypothetical protein [Lachnospiraceae bacterium]